MVAGHVSRYYAGRNAIRPSGRSAFPFPEQPK